MSIRVKRQAKVPFMALIGLVSCTALLAGCTSSRFMGAPLVTNSVNTAINADLNQAMPNAVAATDLPSQRQQLASMNPRAPYVPAADIGASGPYNTAIDSQDPRLTGQYGQVQASPSFGQAPANSSQIVRQQLPTLSSPVVTSTQTMPAMPQVASVDLAKAPNVDKTTTASVSTPRAVPENSFMHRIEAGESLYAIARRYDVTTDSIVSANGLASPDKIFVGQEIIVPGRPGMTAPKSTLSAPAPQALGTLKVAETTEEPVQLTPPAAVTPAPEAPKRVDEQKTASIAKTVAASAPVAPRPIARPSGLSAAKAAQKVETAKVEPKPAPVETKPAEKVQTASISTPAPKVEAATAGFRWPVKGRVIADFAGSKTGLNIEVPEGSSVRAAEAGQVIYVGNAVEGFGNLILIKHTNGFVSAYAHLKDITVAKGTNVGRGDAIGTVGMTGSVNRPQLHFELRKGATPVDPAPLLSS